MTTATPPRASDGHRSPPAAIEQEMCLLGSMMLDPRVIGDVIQILSGEEDFYRTQHAAIYRVLVELNEQNHPVELPAINHRLRALGLLEEVGGTQYLIELVESVTSAASANFYARTVRDAAVRRRLIDTCGEILESAYTSAEPIQDLVDGAEAAIFKLSDEESTQEASSLADLVNETYERLQQSEGKYLTGLDTGFADLNEFTSGLQRGEMIIVAGRPSMGKTAFAVNIAEHIAATNKQPVVIFSLEMSRQQLAQRVLCSRSGVDAGRVRRNMLSPDEFQQLALTAGDLSEAPMYIDDSPGITLHTLNAKARRLYKQYKIQAIFIDYMQLMTAPGHARQQSREQEVSALSRGIKALARELDIPVVCLSQLNRGPESREGHRPRMSDLRESGSIEQDADMVLMLHREEYYHNDPAWKDENPDKLGVAECIIAKQRNGPTDTVSLHFDAKTLRFRDLARVGQY